MPSTTLAPKERGTEHRLTDGRPVALPPGPRSAFLTAARYVRDPFSVLLDAGERFGDPFTWPTFLGPVVVTGDPAGVKDILSADPEIYSALGAELLGPVMGANNLILLSGEAHRAMRRFYNPQFHGDRLTVYADTIAAIAAEVTSRWPTDRPFAVEDTMREISLEVILQVVLGLGDPQGRALFKRAVLELVASLKPTFMFIPALRRPLWGLSAWARFRRRAARAAALFAREIESRRAGDRAGVTGGDGGGGGAPKGDILSLLIASRKDDGTPHGEDEIMEQMISLIGAGHETTASAITWALFHVHRDRAVRDRLLDELGTATAAREVIDAARFPFLDAVCSEALRIDPVAPLVGRTLRADLTLKGRVIPAGASVGIAIINLHRRPDLYPEPERFWPERFLAGSRTPFELLPFGGGSRRCIGAAFAVYEMKIVLATVLRGRPLQLTDPRPVRARLRNTTAAPARKILMTARPVG